MPALSHRVSSAALCFLLLVSLPLSQGHSWLDCSMTLPDGTCAGFPIGYPTRANPDINTLYTYLINGHDNNAPVCQPGRQDILPGNNPPNLPPASVSAGDTLHLTWQPNGHLNNVQSPSEPRTRVQIYWTGSPRSQIRTRGEFSNPSLLLKDMDFATPQNCDDPANPNTICHGDITIPKGTAPGTYQMVWWWRFDKNPIGEEYSTCFEVDVKATTGSDPLPPPPPPPSGCPAAVIPRNRRVTVRRL
ncbi:hypothetical protein BGZ76_011534 [Entomortierella beljakovae]|nr:hypothetical protein BGZ76_011534 [Entomortierella beljakovae]